MSRMVASSRSNPEANPELDRDSLLGLSYGEHLLVWTLRRMAAGRSDCPLIIREFADAFGPRADTALAAFHCFLVELGRRGRRRLRIAPPGWPGVAPDERLLLSIFAAAQARDEDRLGAHLVWLTGATTYGLLDAIAAAVASEFTVGGHFLPLPSVAPASPVIDAAERDLHPVVEGRGAAG